jgi:PAS domain S-box-containing protein
LGQRVKELEQDTAKRKQAEIGLRQSEELFRTLSEVSLESIFLSKNGICLEQNQTAIQMFGYKHAEAIGKPGTNWIIPEDRELVTNQMLAGYVAPYEVDALRNGASKILGIKPSTLRSRMEKLGIKVGRNIHELSNYHDISRKIC